MSAQCNHSLAAVTTAMPMAYSGIVQGFVRFKTMSRLRCTLLRPSFPSISATPFRRAAIRLRSSSTTLQVVKVTRPRTVARQGTVTVPFWHQRSSSYGRFAYQDESSDDSDVEFASSPSHSQQVVRSSLSIPLTYSLSHAQLLPFVLF